MMDRRTRAYLAIGCGVLALLMLIDRSSFGLDLLRGIAVMDACVRERPPEGSVFDFRPLTGLTLNFYLLLASVLATRRFSVAGLEVRVDVPWSVAVTWFQSWYFPVALLRVWDGDFTCGRHANGISGHVLYYVYFAMLFWRHVRHGTASDSPVSVSNHAIILRAILEIGRVAYTVLASLVLFSTYADGYHSLRQLIIGFFFSVIFTCTAVLWCQHFALGHQSTPTIHDKNLASERAFKRKSNIILHIGFNLFCIACFIILCSMNMRPTEYREFVLYLIAASLAVLFPATV